MPSRATIAWRKLLVLVPLLLGAAVLPAPQDMAVPVDVQYPLFLKILTYDRALQERTGEELVVGVLYQERVRESWLAKDAFMEAMQASPIGSVQGVPVRAVPLTAARGPELAQALAEGEVDALYVTPMRAPAIDHIAHVTRARRITTLTGVPAYVEAGLAVGIGLDGRRPEILVNLEAARAEGADFKAPLLRLARIVEE